MDHEDLLRKKNYIYSLNFNEIIEKMISFGGWTKKDALQTCELYKNYLYLKLKYSKEPWLPPSLDIDEFWHNHILDTKKYIADCQAIFGKYLHHYPYFGIDGVTTAIDAQNAFKRTQELYFKEFGHTIPATRSRFAKPVYFALFCLPQQLYKFITN